ncbi:hypothetical protein [Pontibacillus litoralis]|uniref:Conjugal transfer protein n=1 Tax=Pontibacillus litoralis JSM 072002 TaxID=1385512 RepID=A0A0A5G216_9BACI|nr:hypothetical protein [Pontibacillus litoralis]KGX85183.1 hypothetical protein N784_09815 [Pontibacillus litoralis JSM 072002]
MEQDQIKQVLYEMFDLNNKKGREWFFPKNVDNQYKVFANMTLKEIVYFLLPAFLLSGGLAAIPPYNSWLFWIIKAIFIILIILIPVVYIHYRPVKHRDNIRAKDYIKEVLEYQKKKKLYFMKPKNRL